MLAERTGLEPATPGVTGRYSNQLNYRSFSKVLTHHAKCFLSRQLVRVRRLDFLRKSKLAPGNDLLSHGETPHYHRRYCVSLLSSEWIQVVPQLYGFQTNWVNSKSWTRDASLKNWVHTTLSVTLFRVSSNFVFRNISFSYKTHQGCMVKPHESLVQVSSTPHNAYTPCLSTSQSRTALQRN